MSFMLTLSEIGAEGFAPTLNQGHSLKVVQLLMGFSVRPWLTNPAQPAMPTFLAYKRPTPRRYGFLSSILVEIEAYPEAKALTQAQLTELYTQDSDFSKAAEAIGASLSLY
jgi:hypothetical protein